MDGPTPKRTSWIKDVLQIAPPESFDSWEPQSASATTAQKSQQKNNSPDTFFGTIFSFALTIIGSLLFDLISKGKDDSEYRNPDVEHSDFIVLHYDDENNSS